MKADELTWEDVRDIGILIFESFNEKDKMGYKEYYENILRKFKELRP